MGQQDSDRDKEIFLEFASVAGLVLNSDQIDTPDPPQPDVVAMIEGAGWVGYELGEIVDQDLAKDYSLSAETLEIIREHYKTMSPKHRVAFDLRFSDSHINFDFSDQADMRKRRQSLPAIFVELCESTIPENGLLKMDSAPLAGVLKFVFIKECTSDTGPIFGVSHASCFDPSALPILKKKLEKKYNTSNPLELILHSDRRRLHAVRSWLPVVSAYVEDQIVNSIFRRIWIFERHPPSVIYVHPDLKRRR